MGKEESQGYIGTRPRDTIVIDRLYTVHYFEYGRNFRFPGEKHDFWEFVYIDKGEAIASAEDKLVKLTQGEIIFHKPDEWHTISTGAASNTVIVSFSSPSPGMNFFEGRILKVGNQGRKLISSILSESMGAFEGPFGDPYSKKLVRKKNAPVGAEQLIRQYLAELLISFIRDEDTMPVSLYKNKLDDDAFDTIVNYMHRHIAETLTLDGIAADAGMSTSLVRDVFRRNTGGGVITYFIRLKIEYAKKYIRDGIGNLTRISELLGYSSIHYFSRQFKHETGMSPQEYAASVKALVHDEPSD